MILSIVIPVYHEEKNILRVLATIQNHVSAPHEICIVYDDKADPTVGVVETYLRQRQDNNIRLIGNNIGSGHGVMNAIKSGIAGAKGKAIVILMADLSDDVTQIDEMYQLIRQGNDIVCASRYMRGGKKIGGPVIKTLLSKTAGLSLHYLFGVPTHDATNAFKMYQASVLKQIPIESRGGFEYSLEMIVKAYKQGYKITEIPTVWRDRDSGKSKFKVFAWLPEYLKWYFKIF